jgi:hypothetical protein
MASANVRVPILPIYIVRIIIDLPAKLREDVIPVDNPTVPKADISSKSKLRKLFSGSVMESIKVEMNIREIENKAME